MATREDVRQICARLPGVQESLDPFGFAVVSNGKAKGMIWLWNERVEPKKPKVPNPGVLAIATSGLAAKAMWLDSNPNAFFTEPHYNGYPAVLVWLDRADPAELEDLIMDAWKSKASKALLRQFDGA